MLSKIPSGGVSQLVDKNNYVRSDMENTGLPMPGASVQRTVKKGDYVEEFRFSDREIALQNFKHSQLGMSAPGEMESYVVYIPLDKGKAKKSSVDNSHLRREAATEPRPEIEVHASDEVFEGDEMEKEAAVENPIEMIAPKDQSSKALMNRRVNSADPAPLTDPKGGKTRLYPRSSLMEYVEENQRGLEAKTTRPWEQYKDPYSKTAKLASAVEQNLEPYQSVNVWATLHVPAPILDIIMTGAYGSDWFDWEPETLRNELEGSGILNENLEKLFSLQVLHKNEMFWEQEAVFEKICLALNGISPDFHFRQELNVPHMAKAVYLVSFIKQHEYSYEVKAHIAIKAHLDGFLVLPRSLAFAQEQLSKLQPECAELEKQVNTAYANNWPSGSGSDVLSVQLQLLHATDAFVRE